MSEMVERVARAIFGAWATDVGSSHSWEELEQATVVASEVEAPTLHQMHRQAYAEARAAIEAMREPTEAMKLAGEVPLINSGPQDDAWSLSSAAYRVMIDAALASEPKP